MTSTASRFKAQGKRPAGNRETKVMADVMMAATHLGIHVWRTNPIAAPIYREGKLVWRTNASGTAGLCDVCGVCPGGRFIAIEVKAAGGALRPRQAIFLDDVARLGGIAVVAHSGAELVTLLGGQAKYGGWYGIESPFKLNAAERAKWMARVAKEDALKAARRKLVRRAS